MEVRIHTAKTMCGRGGVMPGQGLFPISLNIYFLQTSSEFLPWSSLPSNREDKVREKQVHTQSSTPKYIPREALILSI